MMIPIRYQLNQSRVWCSMTVSDGMSITGICEEILKPYADPSRVLSISIDTPTERLLVATRLKRTITVDADVVTRFVKDDQVKA